MDENDQPPLSLFPALERLPFSKVGVGVFGMCLLSSRFPRCYGLQSLNTAKQLRLQQQFTASLSHSQSPRAFPDNISYLTGAKGYISSFSTLRRCFVHSSSNKEEIKPQRNLRFSSTRASHSDGIPALLKLRLELLIKTEEDLSLTRPPSFDNPDSPSSDAAGKVVFRERAKYLYRLGRAYLAFYKKALKKVWTSFTISRKYNSVSGKDLCSLERCDSSTSVVKEERQRARLWNNVQFIRRSRHDIRKMLPFGLMLVICGEFTPLIILAWRPLGSWLIPGACKIPLQVSQERKDVLTRLRQYENLPPELRPEFGLGLKDYTSNQIFAKVNLIGASIKPAALADLIPTSLLTWTYKIRLLSWRNRNLAEVNLLPLGSLEDLPLEEIVRLCFLIGFVGPPEQRSLARLVRDVKLQGDKVTDFVLDNSEDSLKEVRHLLRMQIQDFKSGKYVDI